MIKELTDKYLSLYSGDNSRITTDRKGNTLIRRSPFRGYLMGEGIASSAVFPLLRDSLGATCKVARFPDADYPVDAYMIPGPIQRLEAYFSKNPDFGGWETVVRMVEDGFAAQSNASEWDDEPEWSDARDAVAAAGISTWDFAKALRAVKDVDDSRTITRGLYVMLRQIQEDGDDAESLGNFIAFSNKLKPAK